MILAQKLKSEPFAPGEQMASLSERQGGEPGGGGVAPRGARSVAERAEWGRLAPVSAEKASSPIPFWKVKRGAASKKHPRCRHRWWSVRRDMLQPRCVCSLPWMDVSASPGRCKLPWGSYQRLEPEREEVA